MAEQEKHLSNFFSYLVNNFGTRIEPVEDES